MVDCCTSLQDSGSSLSCRVAAWQSSRCLCDSSRNWGHPGWNNGANSGFFAKKKWRSGMGCGPDLERSRFSRPCLRCLCRSVGRVNIHSDILPPHNTSSLCATRRSSPPRNNSFLGTRNSTAIPNSLEATTTRDRFARDFNTITQGSSSCMTCLSVRLGQSALARQKLRATLIASLRPTASLCKQNEISERARYRYLPVSRAFRFRG